MVICLRMEKDFLYQYSSYLSSIWGMCFCTDFMPVTILKKGERMDVEANKALVRRYIELWNAGNVELADEVLAPTWVDHAHPEVTGPERVKQAVSKIRAAFPDFRITIESIVGEGDLVALR